MGPILIQLLVNMKILYLILKETSKNVNYHMILREKWTTGPKDKIHFIYINQISEYYSPTDLEEMNSITQS